MPEDILEKYWGYTEFLHPQKEIINSVLSGKDTLAILPTGGGKSVCYQLPAILLKGITIVISPLIALMQDQIQNLNSRGIPAASITSQLTKDEIAVVITRCSLGEIKLLYLAPERIRSKFFMEALQNLPVNLIAVDEAHCISQWGFDFRPSYLKIHLLRELFPSVNILALTATATQGISGEIISALKLKTPNIFRKSLKRNNLTYKVQYSQNELDDLVYELNKCPGVAIVFARMRKKTYEVSRYLCEMGFNAQFFHSKLSKEEKIKRQKIWTESSDQIMVATNAFGMGIDKPDVRTVIHLNLPDSLEAYVQEAGRAGRDGKKSEAVLFIQPYETEDLESIFRVSLPNKKEFEQIEIAFYNYLEVAENERPENKFEFDFNEFIRRYNLSKKKTEKVLNFLERKEVISFKEQTAYGSSIRVLTNPKNINQSKSKEYQLLETLVRKHPGILSDEKLVVEFYLAVELQESVGKIKKLLQKMNDSGYIYYRRRELRLVKFLRPRESNYLRNTLWKEFEKYQTIKWKRLQDIIYFATQQDVCREKLILRYFGEKAKERCGTCDVCLNEEIKIDSEEILDFMANDSKTINEILNYFIKYPKESVLNEVEKLSDKGLIINSGIDSYIRQQ